MITEPKEEDSLMIGKIRKGRSFGGCRYVTQKDDVIASEGVLLGGRRDGAKFPVAMPAESGRGKPVGHSRSASSRRTHRADRRFGKAGGEYLELMGIRNTSSSW